ncbi:MAG TPA: hypothetical protein VFU03_02120 [Gemmatimonadales bacterium]|nr:hypothetical protein [Gemmatimonadales bacterium]
MSLAARGLRDLDNGSQPITDPAELAQVQRQARVVHVKSILSATVLTALLWLL